jgi:hypothetical protein
MQNSSTDESTEQYNHSDLLGEGLTPDRLDQVARDWHYKHELAHEAQDNMQENVQSFLLPNLEFLLRPLHRFLLLDNTLIFILLRDIDLEWFFYIRLWGSLLHSSSDSNYFTFVDFITFWSFLLFIFLD